MTIEARARAKYRYIPSYHNTRNALETAYKEGATEQDLISRADQKKIDTERACEWLRKEIYTEDNGYGFHDLDRAYLVQEITAEEFIKQFKQAMEEQL